MDWCRLDPELLNKKSSRTAERWELHFRTSSCEHWNKVLNKWLMLYMVVYTTYFVACAQKPSVLASKVWKLFPKLLSILLGRFLIKWCITVTSTCWACLADLKIPNFIEKFSQNHKSAKFYQKDGWCFAKLLCTYSQKHSLTYEIIGFLVRG